MPEDRSFSEVNLDMDLGRDPRARDESRRVDGRVFRLAVCGDFSARAGSAESRTGAPGAWRVDRDDFDELLASIAPTLRLELGRGVVAEVRIRELDDFHPDELFHRVPLFARLRDLRARLADPATFRRTAAELSAPPAPRARPLPRSTGSLLDAIIGDEPPASQGQATGDDFYDFIQRSMAPLLVDRPDPRQAELLAQVDASIETVMRALMHHPAFQAAESLWRGVFRLVRNLDTGERLQVHLVDVTRDELLADLLGATTARDSALFRRLTARARSEDGGWGLLVAHHAFGANGDDLGALQRLAAVGSALDAPWLAEALPDLVPGSLPGSAGAAWQHLRGSAEARYLGLALPRVLLRLPYGRDTDATEQFSFEELEGPDAHGSYLWGHPALFCAASLAGAFAEQDEDAAPVDPAMIRGLPLHLVRRDGETTAKPCAEVQMGEGDAIELLEGGLIPMLSFRDQDVVRIARVQSIADPPTRLAGRLG